MVFITWGTIIWFYEQTGSVTYKQKYSDGSENRLPIY